MNLNEVFEVRVGDVFQDLDSRKSDRRVKVLSIDLPDNKAVCCSLDNDGLSGLKTKICLGRLRPMSPKKGFRLVFRATEPQV